MTPQRMVHIPLLRRVSDAELLLLAKDRMLLRPCKFAQQKRRMQEN
jgi:hypothetical protein